MSAVQSAHVRLASAFSLESVPPVASRIARLKALSRAIGARQADLVAAVSRDFRPRAEAETLTAELAFVQAGLRHTVRHLPRWARRRRSFVLRPVPGRTEIWFEPKGVAGILSPWNYPLQLALMPLISAIAAGNRVLLKPSERSPESSAALAALLAEVFPDDEVAVVTGGPEVASEVTQLPLGHLFFTGSTETGRKVAQAAALTLTPVTLELGGRSPAIALPGASIARHAPQIAWGAWLNAGQTCVAPNHLWTPRGREADWSAALLSCANAFLPSDYTGMIDARARDRASAMLAEARAQGATIRSLNDDDPGAPAIVTNLPAHCALRTEEIFGPILPILTYDDPIEILAAEAGGTPLAAYVFDDDPARARAFLARLRSGGGAVNATILHLAAHDLPFGGIGQSGQGAYHGERGFLEFSHQRGVLNPVSGPWLRMLSPPYSPTTRRFFKRMAR